MSRVARERFALRSLRALRSIFVVLAATYVASGFSRTVIRAQQPPPKPSFQTSVEVTSLDVTVVDDRGKPVANLTPADFVVSVDGTAPSVVTAEWISLAA